MANQKIDYVEDEEALFNSYTCPVLYYVQSPSTVSHVNSVDCQNPESALILSPYRSESSIPTRPTNPNHDFARFILSRYSSRSSSNTFHHEKKISYDLQSHEITAGTETGSTLLRMRGVEEHNKQIKNEHHEHGNVVDDEYDDCDAEMEIRRKGCWSYFTFGKSPSFAWILLQLSWRFLVSFCAALLVFLLITNPSPPTMSVKVTGVPQFGLGEGVDQSGVATKILSCNCSMDLNVENKSKLFGLHLHQSNIRMSFGPVVFATSISPELYAENHETSKFRFYVGTKNKAMYGAGRSMQDMLESGNGVLLMIKLRLRSNFRVVGNLIKPKFRHNVECMLVLHGAQKKSLHPCLHQPMQSFIYVVKLLLWGCFLSSPIFSTALWYWLIRVVMGAFYLWTQVTLSLANYLHHYERSEGC